jgi:iron complex transport system ATP-binding protein
MLRLRAEALTHAYPKGKPILQGMSLDVSAGDIVYLLGRNGCGKTTLLQCLSGALKPSEGRIWLDGRDIASYTPSQRARLIGLIPQLHTPAFAYLVRDIVLMGRAPHLPLFGAPSANDERIAYEALERVGIAHYADQPYTQLSGGQRQLVMIARGLAQQCAILLMDETDAHLDLHHQALVMTVVRELAQGGLSFVITSHQPHNALSYASRVVVMKGGRTLIEGTPASTLTPDTLATAYDLGG